MRAKWPLTLALGVLLTGVEVGNGAEKSSELYRFGALRSANADAAREQAREWLASVGKMDQAAFEAIWQKEDVPVLDRVAETLRLGSAEAAKALDAALAAGESAPTDVPALIKDAGQPAFLRANLALAFAKALTDHRVYEQSLEALKAVAPEQVVDPAAYFFHKAVAEHATMQKDAALRSITRLLDDVADAPERYKMVATLMFFDMQSWPEEEKDLTNITRLMDNSERRLALARGGKKTQAIQKKIVFRLDELIKEMENQAGNCQCSGGNCPKGGTPGNGGGANPSAPMQDSRIATNGGPGNVTEQKLRKYAEVWGSLPEAERARAMTEITRDLPPRYREVIENYFKSLARTDAARP
ncbi:MAG TPA: hypothetical protein VIL46_01630 [Gemmataceae bacterium]